MKFVLTIIFLNSILYSQNLDTKIYINEKLQTAVLNNQLSEVIELVKEGADINSTDEIDGTPLSLACSYGYYEIVKFLIDSGAEINKKDNSGNSSLILASLNGHFEIVKILFKNGADLNTKGDYGVTALHHAANYGYTEIAKYLLMNGSKPNEKNLNDNTPSDLAKMSGNIEIYDLLNEAIRVEQLK